MVDQVHRANIFFSTNNMSASTNNVSASTIERWRARRERAEADGAVERYTKAADQGNAEAQLALGDCYKARGETDKARKWWRKAATQGHAEAQYTLGLSYDNFEEENNDEAKWWYNKAAKNGHPRARAQMMWFATWAAQSPELRVTID